MLHFDKLNYQFQYFTQSKINIVYLELSTYGYSLQFRKRNKDFGIKLLFYFDFLKNNKRYNANANNIDGPLKEKLLYK